ncbi:hypothetical protein XENTR_v10015221 [Xenopus tropicalis]|nr:hypothetical protein XENTR_v10015221 [Xenopus tropicalis]
MDQPQTRFMLWLLQLFPTRHILFVSYLPVQTATNCNLPAVAVPAHLAVLFCPGRDVEGETLSLLVYQFIIEP